MPFTPEQLATVGGRRWIHRKSDDVRYYFNNWPSLIGFVYHTYAGGTIANASLDGEPISNAAAQRLIASADKVYYSTRDGKIHVHGFMHELPRMPRSEIARRVRAAIEQGERP